jgi:2-dehydro-3-deoxyphosphooctonate aldolase (KDO 8-P synthase)
MATLYNPAKLLVMAGPCALESLEMCHQVARVLCTLQERHPELRIIFKGSFDKANRTSLSSPRGPGLGRGLEMLYTIRETYQLPTVTDFHLPEQALEVAKVASVLQIPAFLCRQTDMLVAAAETGRVVNVKKGQFLSPAEMRHVIDKLEGAGAAEIWQTERGTTFGYQNLVVDMRSIQLLQGYGHPVVFDATHSVQMPGAAQGTTGGRPEFIPLLMRAALAAGANGLFIETHPNPAQAISDGPNQVPLDKLPALISQAIAIWKTTRDVLSRA